MAPVRLSVGQVFRSLVQKGVTMRLHRIAILCLMLILGGAALTVPSLADPAQQGIVVVPPSSQIQATISVAKPIFVVGETIQIFFSVSQNAYVNVVDIDASGKCTLIFPNIFSNANFVNAGQHVLPDRPTYNFQVTPPAGTEYVQIIASLDPLDLRTLFGAGMNAPFPTLCSNPQTFAQQVQGAIQGIVAVGKVATAFTSFQVVTNQPGNQPPVAQLRVTPSNPFVGQTVQFDASGSFDPNGFIVRYDWDFNGNGVIDQTTTSPFTTFAYSAPGLYSPRVMVTDNLGAQATAQQQVNVQGGSPQPPIASFNFFPANPAVGQPVTFNSTSFDPNGNPIVQQQWDFGDGSSGFGQTVQHIYFSPGTFRVTLTVTDSVGASGQASQFLAVGVSGPPTGPTGFTVNAVDSLHFRISVQGDPNWFSDHLFKIILDTDGVFTGVQSQVSGNASAQGIVPTPNPVGSHLELNGAVRSGRIDFIIGISPNTTKIKFDLLLDVSGNGTPVRNRSFIFLGDQLRHAPSDPFVIILNGGSLVPFLNVQVCLVLIDQPGFSFNICFRFGDL